VEDFAWTGSGLSFTSSLRSPWRREKRFSETGPEKSVGCPCG